MNLSEQALRAMVKQAVIEDLEERRDLLRDVVAEELEDLALVDIIKQGRESEVIDREEVFSALRGQQ